MSARTETLALMQRASTRGINLSFADANALRRAQITLHRWAEMECGDSNDHMSWSIERDEKTNLPYFCVYPHHDAESTRRRIPDKERGALIRVSNICKANGLHFYHQTDPRGCALYIAKEPLPENDYTRGLACC